MALPVKNIMKEVTELELKDEMDLLNMIFKDLYRKIDTSNHEKLYWQKLGEGTLKKIWDNEGDDVYCELLKR